MCRWVLYQGSPITLDLLLTKPVHSIIHQSYKAELREEPLNGDGFGVAWYARHLAAQPASFRSVRPAWNNENLEAMAPLTESSIVLAHVRAASPGLPVHQFNCHPFSAGRYAFMHNGLVADFASIKRRVQASLSDRSFDEVKGSTDSEHVFGLFLDALDEIDEEDPMLKMKLATERAIERIMSFVDSDEPTTLNLAISDGERSVVSRFVSKPGHSESLFFHEGRRYVLVDGQCRMVEPDAHDSTVIVASEPLSEDEGWEPLTENHLLTIDGERGLALSAL